MTTPIYAQYDQLVAKKAELLKQKSAYSRRAKKARRDVVAHEKARIVFTEVSKQMQDETKKRIESLTTLAIRSVFEERDFTFQLMFETKNNRVYCYPIIEENGQGYDPKEDMGGGIIDIISIALKIILWHMENPRKRNVLIIDEPFRFTGKLVGLAGNMIKYLSEKLGIQIIMVSHDDELINVCDQVYKVSRVGSRSKVSLVKQYTRQIRRRK